MTALGSQLLGNALVDDVRWTDAFGPGVRTGARYLDTIAEGVAVDIWASEVGDVSGPEGSASADEIFVVIEGRAEIEFLDTGEKVTVGTGDVVRLHAGRRNLWTTLEPLRKVSFYVPPEGFVKSIPPFEQ